MKKNLITIILVFFTIVNLKAQNELETRAINGVKISFYENEIPKGNHSLIGLYIGTLGVKPFKLFITKVINNEISGYSITGSNNVSFRGTFISINKTYSLNEDLKGMNVKGTQYQLKLSESKNNNKNGIFSIILDNMDTQGTFGKGSWISYDKSLKRKIILQSPFNN